MKVLSLTALALVGSSFVIHAQSAKKAVTPPVSQTASSAEDDEKWLFDRYYGYIEAEVKKGKDVQDPAAAAKMVEYFNTNPELKARKAKLYRDSYTPKNQYKPVVTESDRIALLKGIPFPKEPAAALQADPRENEKYTEKVERAQKQAEEAARQIANTTDLMKTYNSGGAEAVKKQYEAKADQIEIVKDMGGIAAMQNMSEKERQEAAKKWAAKQTGGYSVEEIKKMTPAQRQALASQMAANRSAANGNEVQAAFTQKLMTDKSFRAEYEKMSDAEKQKIYQEFLTLQGATHTQPVVTKEMKENERDAREIIEMTKRSEQFWKDLNESVQPIRDLESRYATEIEAKQKKLSDWLASETEKLPTVRDSEYGPRKDGIERVIFMEAVLRFVIGKDRIAKETEVWEKYQSAYLVAFQKLDEWMAAYNNRTGLSDRLKIELAGLKAAGYDGVIELNRKASYITNGAASVQLNYNCNAMQNCQDPRQDKYSTGQ